VYQPIINPKTN